MKFLVIVALALVAASVQAASTGGKEESPVGMDEVMKVLKQVNDMLEGRFGNVMAVLREPLNCLEASVERHTLEMGAPVLMITNDVRKIVSETPDEDLPRRFQAILKKLMADPDIRNNVHVLLGLEQKIFNETVDCIKKTATKVVPKE